jgi:hypothetical protein
MAQIYRIPAGRGVAIPIADGIRLRLKPGAGGSMDYSEVNGPEANAHIAPQTNVAVATTVEAAWPFYYVTATTSEGMAAVV